MLNLFEIGLARGVPTTMTLKQVFFEESDLGIDEFAMIL